MIESSTNLGQRYLTAYSEMKTKQYIEQIRDGTHYKGTVDFEGTVIEFEIKFGVPIAELEAETMRRKGRGEEVTDEVVRKLFQITIRKKGKKLDVRSKDTLGFLLNLIAMYAIEFYNAEQTRDSNEGPLQHYVSQYSKVKVTFGMSRELDIPKERIPVIFLN